MLTRLIGLLAVCMVIVGCQASSAPDIQEEEVTVNIQLASSAFENKGVIPKKYTCDGEEVSPPLSWSQAPKNTVTFALIVDDPDAPRGTFVHWLLYDLPGTITELPEGIPNNQALEGGGIQGKNSAGGIGYTGPCPPKGTHRYFFKLYALDAELGLDPGANEQELQEAMQGHILAQGELMGTYTKK